MHRCTKSGTTVQSIEFPVFQKFEVNLAPQREQVRVVTKIDELFSRIDASEQALKKVQTLLKTYRQSVLKAAVTGELTKDWRAKNGGKGESGHDLLKRLLKARRDAWEMQELAKMKAKGKMPRDDQWKQRYKEPEQPARSRSPDVPETWGWGSIDQLGVEDRPVAYGVLQPGSDLPAGVPLIRVGDIDDGQVDLAHLKKISNTIAEQYPRTRLHGGEVLITLVGSIGRTAVVPPSCGGYNVARAVGVIPIAEVLSARWVEIWLRSPQANAELGGKAHEVARKTLNLEDVRPFGVPIPPLEEQEAIIERLEVFEVAARTLRMAADLACRRGEGLRQSVLRSAFSGQLVSQDPSDESASVLLERIATERAAASGLKPSRKSRASSKLKAAE